MKQYRITIKLPWDTVEIIGTFEATGIPDLLHAVKSFYLSHDESEYKITNVRRCSRKVVINIDDIYLN